MKKTLSEVDDFNIYIFPEGERNKDKCVKEFQSGAEKIAKANKLDIVPVFINDTLENVFQEAPFEERKKIEIITNFLMDKDLYLLDEIEASLDATSRDILIKLILEYQKQ